MNETCIYRYITKDGKDYCLLFASEHPHQPKLYFATVVYWNRQLNEMPPTLQYFTSPLNVEKAVDNAELWINENLFADYKIIRREQ